ncbi:mitochondrial ribosomal protein L27-domain-containing protein [Neohortaea acidophila]|uniref:Mitochondrial ribosomal protein L27-domain-containing protein n=1 Tax=Neohortaea acidophila TaxID=245834 RepID=A0A6A6PGL1_9PEZI|nr:mitochondrial ribosomal protein L27-domain-containing protein [Neohortaea acidophila]KAF2478437.1 mitochondrial ribosomal protein L27-domain-containing protein [Neohortaea acidophila]
MQPTQALWKRSSLRRLALTTKQGPHNYYKGNRTGSMGQHTKYGGYIVDYKKVRTYVCPDLTGFNLTPFIVRSVEKARDKFSKSESTGPMDGKSYLNRWKEAGGKI